MLRGLGLLTALVSCQLPRWTRLSGAPAWFAQRSWAWTSSPRPPPSRCIGPMRWWTTAHTPTPRCFPSSICPMCCRAPPWVRRTESSSRLHKPSTTLLWRSIRPTWVPPFWSCLAFLQITLWRWKTITTSLCKIYNTGVKKCFFKETCLAGVFWGLLGFLSFIDFSPSNYRGFIGFYRVFSCSWASLGMFLIFALLSYFWY